ncbi:MAG: hypothetical protein Q9190_007014, partial [Brigantiaea leucoxantha]
MPDIRSFFGGKDGQNITSSQENPKQKELIETRKPKGRGKRKILSDSEDEIEASKLKKTTPKKPTARTRNKIESPAVEVTTTSDYFASSGKSKPARSTPAKAKVTTDNKDDSQPPKSTPVKKASSIPSRPASGRTSSRKRARKNYAIDLSEEEEDEDDNFSLKSSKKDDDSSEDMLTGGRNGLSHGGQGRSESEDDEVLRPTHASTKIQKQSYRKTKDGLNSKSESKQPKERSQLENNTDQSGIPSGRKRKSEEMDADENESLQTKKVNSGGTKKGPAKLSPQKAKASEEPPKRSEVQDIFDNIPTVQPPSPPKDAKTGETKKFDFRAAGSRNQAGPAAGSIEIPDGAENCLAGLTFVFTGILNALGRDEGQELVKRYGGKVTTAPSSKTSYVVLGNDAGPKKLETIQKFGLRTINEVGLFQLIEKLPANGGDGKAAGKFEEKQKQEEKKARELAAEMEEQDRIATKKAQVSQEARNKGGGNPPPKAPESKNTLRSDSRLWTVKYAPTAMSMICGNKTQVDKLQAWLRAWPKNLRTKFKMPGKDGFGLYRAVIIHGPPGIGKTTAAHLVAKLEGFDVVESNASDTRSKKLVETGLRGVLDTTSLLGYFSGSSEPVNSEKKKLVLIMDEVDGMSAGDRGGVGALASVCKKTQIPMILICNDRRLPKMAPFNHVTYDLQFRRPTVDQIRSRIMTICYREQLKIPPNVVNAIIEGSHSDIRQIINMLSAAKLDQAAMDFDQGKKMSKDWEKHVILKPWDIVSKILGGGLFAANSKASLNDKIELYFNDHEFSSLMLQENYLGTNPILSNSYNGKEKKLKLLELSDRAAESISDGDLVDSMIHGPQQQWALMPTHAVFSFVRPASFVSGSQAGSQTRFTSWLGNNSKLGKLLRFIKELQGHMRLRSSGDRHQIRQEYLPLLWQKLVKYLDTQGKDAVPDVITLMDSYYLTRDDWDALVELGVGPMDESH